MINVNLKTFTDSNVKLNVASTSVEYARWGELTGNIESQTDLINLLNEKADTTDIPTKTSDLVNDSGYITSAPVTSVNGQTGDVVIPNASSQNYGLAKVDVTMSDTSANPVQNQTVKWYVDNHIPTKTSQLTNDSNFVVDANYVHTANNFTDALKIKLNGIANGAEANVQSNWAETDGTSDSYILNKPVIPSKTSQLTNDSGFITSSSLPTKTSDLTNDSGYITIASVPTKTSDLTNDSGFITDVPHATNSVYGTVKVDVNSDPPAGYIKLTHGNNLDVYTPYLGSTSDTIRSKFLPDATTSAKGAVIVDDTMSDSSTNPVQNSVIKSYIDSREGDKTWYGECSTASSTSTKTVTITGFPSTLYAGLQVSIKFTNSNSITGTTTPTLRINGGTAVTIVRYGTTTAGSSSDTSWNAGAVVNMVYDGTYWVITNWVNSVYSVISQSGIEGSGNVVSGLITGQRFTQGFEARISSYHDSTKQDTANLVTSVSSSSTDSQYPSAKCLYDMVGNIETLLGAI